MPATRSADGLRRAFRVRAVLRTTAFSASQKALLLALNAWPLVHVLGAVAASIFLPWSASGRALGTAVWVFLVPPLLCRIALGRGLATGSCAVPSPDFFRWWATWQLQLPFNRLPWIEETMRFVPGLYSLWLRLWGARIGRLTLWSPGVRIYDRPLMRFGDDVVVGIDARLVGHLSHVDDDGSIRLNLGPVTLANRVTVGGSAFLGPGVVLDSDQATDAPFLGLPYTQWRQGERASTNDDFPRPPSPLP